MFGGKKVHPGDDEDKSSGTNFFTNMTGGITDLASGVVKNVTNVAHNVEQGIEGAAIGGLSAAGKGVGGLGNVAGKGFGGLTNVAGKGLGGLTNVAGKGLGGLTNVAGKGLGGLTNVAGGLTNVAGKGLGGVKGIAGVGLGGLTSGLDGIGGLAGEGLNFMEGLTGRKCREASRGDEDMEGDAHSLIALAQKQNIPSQVTNMDSVIIKSLFSALASEHIVDNKAHLAALTDWLGEHPRMLMQPIGKRKRTLLHIIVQRFQYPAVKAIYVAWKTMPHIKWDPLMEDESGMTPMYFACKSLDVRIVGRFMSFLKSTRQWMDANNLKALVESFPKMIAPYFNALEFENVHKEDSVVINYPCAVDTKWVVRGSEHRLSGKDTDGSTDGLPLDAGSHTAPEIPIADREDPSVFWKREASKTLKKVKTAGDTSAVGIVSKVYQAIINFDLQSLIAKKEQLEGRPMTPCFINLPDIAGPSRGEIDFLTLLYNCDHIEIWGTQVMSVVLDFKWDKYVGRFNRLELISILIFDVLFTVVTNFIKAPDSGRHVIGADAEVETTMSMYSTLALGIILVLVSLVYLILNIVRIVKIGVRDFFLGPSGMYAIIEIVTYILVIVASLMQVTLDPGLEESPRTNAVLAIAAIFVWTNTVCKFRTLPGFGKFVQILIKTVKSVKMVLILVLILVFAFTEAFYLLSASQAQINLLPNEAERFVYTATSKGEDPVYSQKSGLYLTYLMVLGEFGDNLPFWFSEHGFILGGTNWSIVYFIFFMYFMSIVLLNLVIAIMSKEFEKYQGQDFGERNYNMERASVILNFERLMLSTQLNDRKLFPKWLQILKHPSLDLDGNSDEVFEKLKAYVDEMADIMHNQIDSSEAMLARLDVKMTKMQGLTKQMASLVTGEELEEAAEDLLESKF